MSIRGDQTLTIYATGAVTNLGVFLSETQHASRRRGFIAQCEHAECDQAVYIGPAQYKRLREKGIKLSCAVHRAWKSGPHDPAVRRRRDERA